MLQASIPYNEASAVFDVYMGNLSTLPTLNTHAPVLGYKSDCPPQPNKAPHPHWNVIGHCVAKLQISFN